MLFALASLNGNLWNRNVDIFDVIVKALGPMLVLFATLLVSFVVYTFFAYVLPDIVDRSSVMHVGNVVFIGVFVLTNLAYNYAKA
eukprot:2732944-Amphidinium_carterae.1